MKAPLVCAAATCALFATNAALAAEPAPPNALASRAPTAFVGTPARPGARSQALELGAFGGYARPLRGLDDRGTPLSQWHGGGAVALSLTYRSPYFARVLSPFVDVGYYPLYRASRLVDPVGDGLGVVTASALDALGVAAGLGLDVWRLRLRAGVALYDVRVRTSVFGSRSEATELDGGYLFSIAGDVVRRRGVTVGLEARLGLIVEADAPFAAVGAKVAWDAVHF